MAGWRHAALPGPPALPPPTVSGWEVILHADLDAFFASVEQRDDVSLRGRPMAVGTGVVLAASYPAKALGVRTAMPVRTARALCRDLVVVPPRFEAYSRASAEVFAVFRDTSARVEGVSIDEAFLDIDGLRRLRGEPDEIGRRLRAEVAARVGLAITVGIGRTRLVAKVAGRVAKPDGLRVVPDGTERAFLDPLPVELLWGVGRVTAQRLHERGVRTVADLADLDPRALGALLGAAGPGVLAVLHPGAAPLDGRRGGAGGIRPGRRRRSIGAQRALGPGLHGPDELDRALVGLVERVCRRLRGADRRCRTVVLRLRLADFGAVTRSHTLAGPTHDTASVLAAGRRLLADAMPLLRARGVTLVGVTLTGLDDAGTTQLELPLDDAGAQAAPGRGGLAALARHGGAVDLDATLDGIRDRFGAAAVTRGSLVGRSAGVAMPVLPDPPR